MHQPSALPAKCITQPRPLLHHLVAHTLKQAKPAKYVINVLLLVKGDYVYCTHK